MANAELYQGNQERSFSEKAAWYLAVLGLAAIGVGVAGGSDSLAAVGLTMAVGGIILGSASGKSK